MSPTTEQRLCCTPDRGVTLGGTRKRQLPVTIVAALALVSISVIPVFSFGPSCTPPDGWVLNSSMHGPNGEPYYSPSGNTKAGMMCSSASRVQAAPASGAIHNVACAQPLPGKEAVMQAVQRRDGINCADPRYAKPAATTVPDPHPMSSSTKATPLQKQQNPIPTPPVRH